jgi:photosystem II stability/assembly factor-like uncharacterized protein
VCARWGIIAFSKEGLVRLSLRRAGLLFAFASFAASALSATSATSAPETFSPSLFGEMRWRCIGPFRGGRTVGAAGVPQQPGVFYMGVNNGGVWKTDDYGRTWRSVFEGQPTQSIGTVAVAPSDPNVVYAGSGEGLQRPDLSVGDGFYRSTDAGKTWKHTGLLDAQQIGAIAVDPRDPKRLFVAVLGHPYGANEERGLYRSTDGGDTFAKTLYKDKDTGAIAVAFDPKNSDTVYAVLWQARMGPWENSSWNGPGSGLFKSTDGGATWKRLEKGLPTFEQGLGRIGFAVAPSEPSRMYATVELKGEKGGLFVSDDAGDSWRKVNEDVRIVGRGSDFAEVKVHPKEKDVLYVANTSTYRSTDAGKTFTAWKGAPGGDDYHTFWIHPEHPEIVMISSDQGATITVNGGGTWSSWYNQPTAQLYHVSTDSRFPYWVYGGQQESGSAAVASRGDYGAITAWDWHPVAAEEYGYVAADPLDRDVVYGGKLTRFRHSTKEAQDVSPAPLRAPHRFLRTAPVLFSPVDPHVLFYAGEVLFKTTNGGTSWDVISPDLSREKPDVPESVGVYKTAETEKELGERRRGVIYTVAPSPQDVNLIWAGTDDGLIHVTKDGGKTWTDVTPKELTSWSKVSLVEASHFDKETAYAAINRIRCDDMKPHILATHDGGKTWTEIVSGLPNAPVNAVREDHVRKGLLYAGTELGVAVSFDDGARWQSLNMNLPPSSVRDLVIHEDDLVVGTHGRSFWILDDVTPLRQLSNEVASASAHLFAPEIAWRFRRSRYPDTPLPPEEPAGQNPPDGAILDYVLKAPAQEVVLEIADASGQLVRRYSSADKPEVFPADEHPIPAYWVRAPRLLSKDAGMHRFVWDLRSPPPDALDHEYPISAVPHDTPRVPLGPSVVPGTFTVKLSVDGKPVGTRPLTVKMDPRLKVTTEGLGKAHAIATRLSAAMHEDAEALRKVKALRAALKERAAKAKDEKLKQAIAEADEKAAALEGNTSGGRRGRRSAKPDERDLAKLNSDLATLLILVDDADAEPTTQAVATAKELDESLAAAKGRWADLGKELPALDAKLKKAGLGALPK